MKQLASDGESTKTYDKQIREKTAKGYQVTFAGETFGTGALVSTSTGPLADVRDIAASRTHTCAVTAGGSVYCWGGNTYGELGRDPAVTASSNEALLVTIPD